MTVLIVDDSEFMRATLRKKLDALGLHVVGEASGVREAVSVFTNVKPDLVTLDITMPDGSGLDCIPDMLALKPACRIIVMTSLTDQETIIESMTLGAVAFINKPFNNRELAETIQNVTGSVISNRF